MRLLTEHALRQQLRHRCRGQSVHHCRRSGGAQGDRPYWFFYMHTTRRAGSSPACAEIPVPREGFHMTSWGTSVIKECEQMGGQRRTINGGLSFYLLWPSYTVALYLEGRQRTWSAFLPRSCQRRRSSQARELASYGDATESRRRS